MMKTKNIPNIDSEAALAESRGVIYKIKKSRGEHTARYVQITPGSGGGVFGHALHLFVKNKLVFSRFLPFADAINRGNAFVADSKDWMQEEGYEGPADESCEQAASDDARAETLEEFEMGNVRTVVGRNPLNPNLYNVNIYVDKYYVIQIFKDCNYCKMYDYPTAAQRAKDFLPMLQGWKR